jgi:hypothetical protein
MSAFIAGFILGALVAAFACAILMILPKRRAPAPTMAQRKKRHLYSELCEGVEALRVQREAEEGVQYKFMGVTGSEE